MALVTALMTSNSVLRKAKAKQDAALLERWDKHVSYFQDLEKLTTKLRKKAPDLLARYLAVWQG